MIKRFIKFVLVTFCVLVIIFFIFSLAFFPQIYSSLGVKHYIAHCEVHALASQIESSSSIAVTDKQLIFINEKCGGNLRFDSHSNNYIDVMENHIVIKDLGNGDLFLSSIMERDNSELKVPIRQKKINEK